MIRWLHLQPELGTDGAQVPKRPVGMFGHFILNAFMRVTGDDQEVMLCRKFPGFFNGGDCLTRIPCFVALALEPSNFPTLDLHP